MAVSKTQRKLTAILCADVVGYSRLMGDDEEATLETLTAYREVFTSSIPKSRGRVVDAKGDAILAEFAAVTDAVSCAVEIQRVLADRNTGLTDTRRMDFRIGINLGEVMVKGEEIYGDGVNIAARLESLAEPGGICISRSAYDQVESKLNLDCEYLGEQQVKNIARPVRAYRVLTKPGDRGPRVVPAKQGVPGGKAKVFLAVAGVVVLIGGGMAWNFWPSVQTPKTEAPAQAAYLALPDKPSVAVLPFENMSGDPEQEYFSDGITEDIITDLSKVSGLFVISRNSTFVYKGRAVKLQQVGRELGVKYVLEGSVRRAGDQVRINAQLIDVATGGHVWADRYDGSITDVFALQDKVTGKIVGALAVSLTLGEQEQVARKETENPEAYDSFLQGWNHYLRERPDDFRQAIALFEKAVKLDPQYSRAHAALAATYWQIWKRFWFDLMGLRRSSVALGNAENYLDKALLNPTPLAHQVGAGILSQQGRHEEAIEEAKQAISLDPNTADSYLALAGTLSLAGRPGEALRMVKRAMRLNPYYPPSYLYGLGMAHFGMRNYRQAAESLERAMALNPDDRWSARLLLASYGHLGRKKEATGLMKIAAENWTGHDPLNIRSIAFWYPFQKGSDAEDLAAGLRKADVPD